MTGSERVGTCRKCGQSLGPTDTTCPSRGYEVALPPVAHGFLGEPGAPTPAAAKAALVVGAYVIAMSLGLVVALALGFGVAYLGWVVVEDEDLYMMGVALMLGG